VVWSTGDPHQPHPRELPRPLLPEIIPPPVSSLAPPPEPDEFLFLSYTSRRKDSTTSGFLPFPSRIAMGGGVDV
jgi:hypothetical protein